MRSLNAEEIDVLRFIRANGCVSAQDICRVSYADEAAVSRVLKGLTDLGLVRETAAGIEPVDQAAVEE